jgi:hypothetical protein
MKLLRTGRIALIAVTGVALSVPPGVSQVQVFADTVYLHGSVVTMDTRARTAQAVAVKGDRILAVGTDAEIGRLASPQTVVVDLHGKAMLPGFYAAHDHLPEAGVAALYHVDLNSPPVGKIQNMADVIAALNERAQSTPPGGWIVGEGYDDTLLSEQRHPTRYDLDEASRDHPIWIYHVSGHLGAANSKALEIAGITRTTPQPQGGRIREDPKTGEPTGVIEESLGLVARHIPPLSARQTLEAIRWCGPHYVSRGVTTTVIANGSAVSLRNLQLARRAGWLPLRVVTMSSRGSPISKTNAESGGMMSGFGDEWLKLGAVKIWSDGSIQGYTGYLTNPYYKPPGEDPKYRGYPSFTREDLTGMVVELNQEGYQIAIHGNGDAVIDDILYAYNQALQQQPRPDARHRIEHCQTVREDQLDEIKRLGITPSFFVGHVYYWGDRHRDIFLGAERAARISPLASAVRRGVRFTLHDDTPVTPVNPLMLVWDAVNRLTRSGKVLGADQRITPLQALRAVTIDAAWQNFEERSKGSIEPDKLADFVVLEENPLTSPPVLIKDIRISMTIVGGKTVYQANHY